MNSKKLSGLVGTIVLTIGLVGCGQKTAVKVTSKPKAVVQKAKPVPQKTIIVNKTINNSAVIVNKTINNNKVIVNKNKTIVSSSTAFVSTAGALTIASNADPTETISAFALPYDSVVGNNYYIFQEYNNALGGYNDSYLCVRKDNGKVYSLTCNNELVPWDYTSTPTPVVSSPTPTSESSHTSAYIDSTGSTIQVMCEHYTGRMTPLQALAIAKRKDSAVSLVDNRVYMINGGTFYEFTMLNSAGNDEGSDYEMIVSTASGKVFKYSCDNKVAEWTNMDK